MHNGRPSHFGISTLLAVAVMISVSPGPPNAQAPSASDAVKARFLHYRWHKDGSIALVGMQEIPARLKPSRSATHQQAARPVSGLNRFRPPSGMTGDGNVLTYALFSATGDTLSQVAIPDPGELRVEIQEKGESQLRSHVVKQDSGDIFLRIAEPEAQTIRFFKWHPLAPKGALPKAAASKTVIAEFKLP